MKKRIIVAVAALGGLLVPGWASAEDEPVTNAVPSDVAAPIESPSMIEIAERAVKEAADKLADKKAEEEKAESRAKEAKAEAKEIRGRLESRIFRLEHASAEEVADKLNEIWSGDFGTDWKMKKIAVPFQESNSVIVTAPRGILDSCGSVISGLDVDFLRIRLSIYQSRS